MSPFVRSGSAYRWVMNCAAIIEEAEADGIGNVAPVLCAYRGRPKDVKRMIGKGAWRQVHHSELRHNVWRAWLLLTTRLTIDDVLSIPNGGLTEAPRLYKRAPDTFRVSCGFAQNRDQLRESTMLCRDFVRMGGEINPAWSLSRLRREHDLQARHYTRLAEKEASVPWCEEYSETHHGLQVTLLRSHTDFAAEGRAMRHCVASYASSASRGEIFVFRIEGLERATASFGRGGLREISGRCNGKASRKALSAASAAWAEFKKLREITPEPVTLR